MMLGVCGLFEWLDAVEVGVVHAASDGELRLVLRLHNFGHHGIKAVRADDGPCSRFVYATRFRPADPDYTSVELDQLFNLRPLAEFHIRLSFHTLGENPIE